MEFLKSIKPWKYIAFAILLLSGVIFVILFYAADNGETCNTDACHQTGDALMRSMDFEVDPCEDFYQFTCANWDKQHSRPQYLPTLNLLTEAQISIWKQLYNIFERNETTNDPKFMKQIRTFHQACMNTEQIDTLGLKPAIEYLRSLHLPDYPSAIDEMFHLKKDTPNKNFDWVTSIAEIKKTIDVDLILGFVIIPNFKNNTKPKILFSMPLQKSIFEVEKDPQVRTKLSIVKKIMFEFASTSNENIPKSESFLNDNIVLKIFQIDETLAKLEAESKALSHYENIQFAANEFKNETDQILIQYLKTTFANVDPNFDISDYEIFKFNHYLHNVMKYVSTLSKVDLENYIWWKVVIQLLPHISSKAQRMPQWLTCSMLVHNFFGTSLSQYIVNRTFINSAEFNATLEMLSNIRTAFRDSVNEIDWIDNNDTKPFILEKSDAIESFLGFPDWIFNEEIFDELYSGVNCSATNHLENILQIQAWFFEKSLILLKTPEILEKIDYDLEPTTVNAAYNPFQNRITVPWAIMESSNSFRNLGLEVLNYGALGTTLGHEWIHGFDNNGRDIDKNGNFGSWWSKNALDQYKNRAKCFIDQYKSYYMPEIGENVDGNLTLGENIADNGGLRIAYNAYKLYAEKHGKEKRLPKLEKFTSDQLFFISFGNRWCEDVTSDGLEEIKDDEHCQSKFRVNGALYNSAEFKNAFKCSNHSKMVSKSPCRIW